jgi:hypothetical protein
MIKAISSVGGDTGLFKVSANGWRGFQFDDPAKKAKKVALELYDPEGSHVEIVLAVRKDATNPPTQSEINRILISSIKREVKKKNVSGGWNFSCFAAHLNEQDLF